MAKDDFIKLPFEMQLGDKPVEEAFRTRLVSLMEMIDEIFNGELKHPHKKVGIVMLLFPYGDGPGRCNFISNGANRDDLVELFEEMIVRFKSQPKPKPGRA